MRTPFQVYIKGKENVKQFLIELFESNFYYKSTNRIRVRNLNDLSFNVWQSNVYFLFNSYNCKALFVCSVIKWDNYDQIGCSSEEFFEKGICNLNEK